MGALLVGVVLVAVVWFGARRFFHPRPAPEKTVLPAFTEPGSGPRATRFRALGVEVGRSSLADVRAMLAARGLDCPDTSIRALMRQMRADKQRELEELKKKGAPTDAVSGASALKRQSPREQNPQVRLSCEGVASETLGDRTRAPSTGRWLFVFDSPEHPLRHVSFERSFPAARSDDALRDASESVQAMTAVFGLPTTAPKAKDGGAPGALPLLAPVQHEWSWSDLRVAVTALNYGPRGTNVGEIMEVPWPVRSDLAAGPPRSVSDGAVY